MAIEYLPFDVTLMSKANAITEAYIDQMMSLSRTSQKRDRIYGLGVQFFNVQKNFAKDLKRPTLKRKNYA